MPLEREEEEEEEEEEFGNLLISVYHFSQPYYTLCGTLI